MKPNKDHDVVRAMIKCHELKRLTSIANMAASSRKVGFDVKASQYLTLATGVPF
jgi:hypothetical protein